MPSLSSGNFVLGARSFSAGRFDDPSEEGTGPQHAAPEILIRLAPRLSQATEVRQLAATRFDRRKFVAHVALLFPEDIHVARERRQHMQVFMTLGHESRVKRAQGSNVPSRFVMQSFTTTAGTAHISNKPRAVSNRRS